MSVMPTAFLGALLKSFTEQKKSENKIRGYPHTRISTVIPDPQSIPLPPM